MSLLKTFGVGTQQMMFSELLDHITKDAVDDLFDADPSEEALKKGAELIVQIFFWMKENIESHMLGTSEDTSTRAATRAEMETLEREDEAVPLTADVAVELRRILQHVYAVFEILDQNEDFEEPAGEVRPTALLTKSAGTFTIHSLSSKSKSLERESVRITDENFRVIESSRATRSISS